MAFWNAGLAAGWRTMFWPTVGTALRTECYWLHVICPACQQLGEVNLHIGGGPRQDGDYAGGWANGSIRPATRTRSNAALKSCCARSSVSAAPTMGMPSTLRQGRPGPAM